MYVCGPTVYDMPHIGHGRVNLTFDILRRYLSFTGLTVHHVANITDVDDNIIKRAAELGPHRVRRGGRIRGSLVGVHGRPGCLRPHETPHATQYIEDMVGPGGRADGRDMAYETPTASTSRSPRSTGYGLLARSSRSSRCRSGRGSRRNEDKRSPLDFALWKKAKEGEPSWDVAVGAGPARLAHRVRGHVARPAG